MYIYLNANAVSQCRINGLTGVLGPARGSGSGSLVRIRLAAPQTSEPGGRWDKGLVMGMRTQLIEETNYVGRKCIQEKKESANHDADFYMLMLVNEKIIENPLLSIWRGTLLPCPSGGRE